MNEERKNELNEQSFINNGSSVATGNLYNDRENNSIPVMDSNLVNPELNPSSVTGTELSNNGAWESNSISIEEEPNGMNSEMNPIPVENATLNEGLMENNQMPTEVGQVREQEQIHTKEKNNFIFIFALFAFVGIFILLLPFLIKFFGY